MPADNSASVEFSLDASSKSATNLAMSRPRPVTVPVHSLPADHRTFQQLVSYNTLCTVHHLHGIHDILECTCLIGLPAIMVDMGALLQVLLHFTLSIKLHFVKDCLLSIELQQ